MSEILLALLLFSQVKIGLGLVLCVIPTVDISFTVRDHTFLISNYLSSDLMSVMV